MTNHEPLTDLQWQLLEPLFPNPVKRTRGKPHTPWRSVMNSIFYVLFTGLKWGSLPKDPAYATKSAAHRWFVLWEKSGFLKQIVETYQTMAKMGSDIKLPRRRNRMPAAKRIHLETVAVG
jgi:transposase